MKNLIFLALVLLTSLHVCAQKKQSNEVITIQTTAECEQCKDRIESKLNFTKGIKYAQVDLETKKVKVKFNQQLIKKEEILQLLSKLGYDADELKADPAAYEALPACCKINGMHQH